MSWFDIIIALLLLASFVRGIRKGLIMQLAGFAAIILGAIFAGKAAEAIEPFLLNTVNISRNVGMVISYILAFIVIVFGVRLIGNMLHGLFKALHISILNKILGATRPLDCSGSDGSVIPALAGSAIVVTRNAANNGRLRDAIRPIAENGLLIAFMGFSTTMARCSWIAG